MATILQIINNRGIGSIEISQMDQIDAIAYASGIPGTRFMHAAFPVRRQDFLFTTHPWDLERRGTFARPRKGQRPQQLPCFSPSTKHLVGDFENGNLGLSRDVFDDGGLPIVWERTFPHHLRFGKRLCFPRAGHQYGARCRSG